MKLHRLFVAGAAALAPTGTVGCLAGRVLATGAPTQSPLLYSGTVADAAGKPYPTAIDVSVAFYDQAAGGTLQCHGAVRMCSASQLAEQYPLVEPAAKAWLKADPYTWGNSAFGKADAAMVAGNDFANCYKVLGVINNTVTYTPFAQVSNNTFGMHVDTDGAFGATACSVKLAVACCGP